MSLIRAKRQKPAKEHHKMRNIKITAIGLILLAGFILAESALAGRVANRQTHQQNRIYQGVASGELTSSETRRLERTQNRIQKNKQQAMSDGQVTVRERARIEKQQDKASRQIYRLKHNGQDK